MLSVKSIPNCVTSIRILGAVVLLFTQPFTTFYYIVYGVCGFTDAIDGFLARKLHAGSQFGTLLDSVADLMFYAAMLIHMIPHLWHRVPMTVWYWVGAIMLLRLVSYLTAAFKYHRFASLHTYGNKVTGAGMFLLPFLILLLDETVVCTLLCVVGTLSTLEELLLHLLLPEYRKDVKCILMLRDKSKV